MHYVIRLKGGKVLIVYHELGIVLTALHWVTVVDSSYLIHLKHAIHYLTVTLWFLLCMNHGDVPSIHTPRATCI